MLRVERRNTQRVRSETDLPINPHLSTSPHSLAARPAPAASVPPGPLRQTLFYRPGCLPVIGFSRPFAWTVGRLAPVVPAIVFGRAYRGEKSFFGENSRSFPAPPHCPFLTTQGKVKPTRGRVSFFRPGRLSKRNPRSRGFGLHVHSPTRSAELPVKHDR